MLYLIKIIIFISLISLSLHSHAFKLNTHVWIAQQVIDDLEDGYIEISVNGKIQKFQVNANVRNAILNNPKAFRMGSVGPDASPDVIIGQFAIHPGPTTDNPQGLGTDEWAMALETFINDPTRLNTSEAYAAAKQVCENRSYNLDQVWAYINGKSDKSNSSSNNPFESDEVRSEFLDVLAESIIDKSQPVLTKNRTINQMELAYLQGFKSHIAADVFAHTYVNHYSGDVYWLTDGEVDVEKRHTAIESYIDQRIPKLPQGAPYDLLPKGKEIPAEFLADAFIFNDKLKSQFKNYSMTSYAYTLNRYRAAIREAATDCVWTAISRFAGQAVIGYVTGGAWVPNEKQITAINNIIDDVNAANVRLLDNSQKIKSDIDKIVLSSHKEHFRQILDATNQVSRTLDRIIALDQDLKNKAAKVNDLVLSKKCNLEKSITQKVCKYAPPFLPSPCDNIVTPMCATYSIWQTAEDARKKADELLIKTAKESDALFKEQIVNLRDVMTSVMVTTNLAIEATNQMTMALGASLDPMQSILIKWEDSVNNSVYEWVRAHAEVQFNSMNVNNTLHNSKNCWSLGSGISDCLFQGGKGLEPLNNWINTYSAGLIGMPTELSKLFQSVNETIDTSTNFLKSIQPIDPLTGLLQKKIEEKVSKQLSGINVTEELIKLTKDKDLMRIYKDAHALFFMKWEDPQIDLLFQSAPPSKWLQTYSKMTDILNVETGSIYNDNKIDLNTFNALYNSVVLSKLSLLDATQLNRLAAIVGIRDSTFFYGQPLYQGSLASIKDRELNELLKLCENIIRNKANMSGEALSRATYNYNKCKTDAPNTAQAKINEMPESYYANNILYGAIKSIDGSEAWRNFTNDNNLSLSPHPKVTGWPKTVKSQYFYRFSHDYQLSKESELAKKYGSIYYKGFRFWQEDAGSSHNGDYYFGQIFKLPIYGTHQ